MNLLRTFDELSRVKAPVHLAVGVFDGLHPGHRAVIQHAIEKAQENHGTAVVVTFDPHPQRVLRPEDAPRMLTSTHHKVALLREMNVGTLLLLSFDQHLASTSAEDFIQTLSRHCAGLSSITVGHEWSFGKDRKGNLKLLASMGRKIGFEVTGIPPVKEGVEVISSTRIRQAVNAGDFTRAAELLGRPFSVLGRVEQGAQLGRSLGFPTANLVTGSEQFPPDGVYAVTAWHEARVLEGVVNIGVRPTVTGGAGERLLELHLLDFNGDLYGEEVEVVFRNYLRPEIRFANVHELKEQIATDVAEARKALADCADLAWSGRAES